MFMTEICVCDAMCWCRYWLCSNTLEHVHHKHILVQGDLSKISVHSWCTLSHYHKFSHHADIEWSSSKYKVCVCNVVYTVTPCLTQFVWAWVWLFVIENKKSTLDPWLKIFMHFRFSFLVLVETPYIMCSVSQFTVSWL